MNLVNQNYQLKIIIMAKKKDESTKPQMGNDHVHPTEFKPLGRPEDQSIEEELEYNLHTYRMLTPHEKLAVLEKLAIWVNDENRAVRVQL